MKTTFLSVATAVLITALVWASIIVIDPDMNLDIAYGMIVGSFIGSVVLTALVLTLRGRSRKQGDSPST